MRRWRCGGGSKSVRNGARTETIAGWGRARVDELEQHVQVDAHSVVVPGGTTLAIRPI